MLVLVTGAAGYIGSMLVPLLLSRGHKVRALDNLMHGGRSLLGFWSHPGFQFLRGDIRDLEAVRSALSGVDAVVHLAAIVGDPACASNPGLAQSVNYDASLMLLDESKKQQGSRFVFASTCSNYGKMKDSSLDVDETSELKPVSLYANTKVKIERMVLDPTLTDGICATSLRFATAFGVSNRMRFDLTVNHFSMELMVKKHLVVYGEQFWRPYIHVRDIARAVLMTLEAPLEDTKNQVFNVGSTDQNFQKKRVAEMIQVHIPEATVEYVHKDEDPRDYRVSFSKIHDILGFKITRTVNEGIQEIIDLYRHKIIEDYENLRYRN